MPTVSLLPGYTVLWPSVLVFFVSVARINPLRPPWMVAVSVEFGRETTARPDMKATHLMHPEEGFSCWVIWTTDESRKNRRRKRSMHGNDREERRAYCTAGALCNPPSNPGGNKV